MYVVKGQHQWQKLYRSLEDTSREEIQKHSSMWKLETLVLLMLAYLIGPSNDPSGEGLLLCPFYTPGKLKVEHWQCIVQDHRVHKQKKRYSNPSSQISRAENSLKNMIKTLQSRSQGSFCIKDSIVTFSALGASWSLLQLPNSAIVMQKQL